MCDIVGSRLSCATLFQEIRQWMYRVASLHQGLVDCLYANLASPPGDGLQLRLNSPI